MNKEFIFDEDECCINPNRVEGGDKDFWFEIQTACKDGRWYHGHRYWTRGNRFKWDVYLHTNSSATEREAILKEIELVIKWLEHENNDVHSRLEVPEKVFKQLKELKEECKHPQLKMF